MHEDIRDLIEILRRGRYENSEEKINLLAAALIEHQADVALTQSLLRAPQMPLRLAALKACRPPLSRDLIPDLVRLAQDSQSAVREALCDALAILPAEDSDAAFQILGRDPEEDVRTAVVKATGRLPAFRELHQTLLRSDASWTVRHAAAEAVGQDPSGDGLPHLLSALGRDNDADVRLRCADFLEKAFSEAPGTGGMKPPTDVVLLGRAERNVLTMGDRVPRLLAWLRSHTRVMVDPAELVRFGTDLTAEALSGALPRAFRLAGPVRLLMERLRSERARSLALLGKSGVGKSSLVHELVHELARPENGSWRVIRVSPTDFMTGTKYVGEWETKLKELIDAVRHPRKVLVYIPNLADLAAMGRWSKSNANVASALAPYLEDGTVRVIGESTPEEFERGLGGELALQRLFERVLIEEGTAEETRAILADIRDEAGALIGDEVLRVVQEVSESFLGHLSSPGNAATLLRSVIHAVRDQGRPTTRRDVLEVLSQSTGVPAGLLDDGQPMDLSELGAFFEQRIVGQPEAVSAMADVVTLIKAGLTDPNKPFSVMLFVGPTGVGKTEMARALAEYIFGDPGRLVRLDMSEFASPDGFTRLTGGKGENGLLTDAVRQRPFSVVLLDEIEKSHVNVFDLCLQIFDAGRLTDGRGRLADFRRSIVILTSNIGAGTPAVPLGFGRPAEASATDPDRTFRELSRVFRPEFLNRLDRIVSFNPLSMETAERIARRELDLVLQRSGIVRRRLTLNVDPRLIALLVRQGYSQHFGARPLKRTVEKLVLLPLAQAIATGRAEPRSVLSLGVDGDSVTVRITPPESTETSNAGASRKMQGKGRTVTTHPVSGLQERCQRLESAEWPSSSRKSELLGRSREAGFYQDAARREATFDELNRIEQFLTRRTRLREAIDRLVRQAQDPRGRGTESFAERTAELETELDQLEFITHHPGTAELSDALVMVSQVRRQGALLKPVDSLVGAYRGLAARRNFQATVIAERQDDSSDIAVLQVLGLGAVALFSGEEGLHEFNRRSREKNPRSGREQTREDTTLVRVEVFPVPSDPPARFVSESGLKASARPVAGGRMLEAAPWRVVGFHTPSIRSLDLWFSGSRSEALATAAQILHAQVAHSGSSPSAGAIIRRYDLGIGSKIKDLRTGRTTTRLTQFFRGQFEPWVRQAESTQ